MTVSVMAGESVAQPARQKAAACLDNPPACCMLLTAMPSILYNFNINGFVLKLYDLNNDGYLKKDELFIWLKDSLIVDAGTSVGGDYDDDIKVHDDINNQSIL